MKRALNVLCALIVNYGKNLNIGYFTSISNVKFGIYNSINDHCVITNSSLGNFTYISTGTRITRTSLGAFCSIGPECMIGLGKHPSQIFISTHPVFFSTLNQSGITFSDRSYFNEFQSIEIGNDVWIGARSIVLDGVKIGNGAIIAAGSVVTRNIPPYSIVGGVPAKIIRYRFTDSQIEFIDSSRWWEFDIKFLQSNFKNMHNFDSFKKMVSNYKN